jgi:hypothetical protein
MALSISILTAFGFIALYWKIRSVTRVNDADSPVNIILDGYKDQAARDNGAPAVASRAYQAPGADIDAIEADDQMSAAYEWLKINVPELQGAVDA